MLIINYNRRFLGQLKLALQLGLERVAKRIENEKIGKVSQRRREIRQKNRHGRGARHAALLPRERKVGVQNHLMNNRYTGQHGHHLDHALLDFFLAQQVRLSCTCRRRGAVARAAEAIDHAAEVPRLARLIPPEQVNKNEVERCVDYENDETAQGQERADYDFAVVGARETRRIRHEKVSQQAVLFA